MVTHPSTKWFGGLVLFHYINGLQSGPWFGGGVIPMSLLSLMFLSTDWLMAILLSAGAALMLTLLPDAGKY